MRFSKAGENDHDANSCQEILGWTILSGDGVEGINCKFQSNNMVNIKTQRAAEMLVQLIVAPILFVRMSSTFRNFIFVLN